MKKKDQNRQVEEISIGDKVLKLETHFLAPQANAAVLARYGDTVVLATVVAEKMSEELDYFPLGVEYFERFYAGGRIKGSRWVKREGRPSDEAILTARLIDRSIRPLFPKAYKSRVQVVLTILSVDLENNPDVPAICAASAALAISDIPWAGPIAGLRLGLVSKDGEENFVVNPTYQDLEYSEIDIVFSGNEEAVLMIEGMAQQIPEETLVKALNYASEEIKKITAGIAALASKMGVKKQSFEEQELSSDLVKLVEKEAGKEIKEIVLRPVIEKNKGISLDDVIQALQEKFPEEEKSLIKAAVEKIIKKTTRGCILKEGKRIDGRRPDEIRPLTIEVDVLPRTHGSAMFKRGWTQALTIATLGAPSLEQFIENMEGEETKRYMHHYNMPPFSLGETGRMGWPSRREIGHGALAERAIEPVLPDEDKFPYAVRVVSEIMSSNGSTSMAAVCGSTLSLMDAGVPLKSPVAGIAMGLVSDGKKHVVLSDILGQEDFQGDMDFKVTGTKDGVTAIQMDVKNTQIPLEVLAKAFEQARVGRLFILENMLRVLPDARGKVSEFAPKVRVVKIAPEKIGEVVGPGGRTIRKIIAESGATVDIEDDGSVNIVSPDEEAVTKAVAIVEGITREVKVDDEFEGEVKRIQSFGAFVELAPGKEGLVHVSQMSTEFIKDPSDVVSIGQKVQVRVIKIDEMKRINLTMLPRGAEKSSPRNSSPTFSGKRDSFQKRPSLRGRESFGRRPSSGKRDSFKGSGSNDRRMSSQSGRSGQVDNDFRPRLRRV
ncbi:polyribonucleotide nucleotidyltransferase [Patescibacteria group bacterium]